MPAIPHWTRPILPIAEKVNVEGSVGWLITSRLSIRWNKYFSTNLASQSLLSGKEKIIFYNHPDEARQDQISMASEWSVEQVLQYHEECKAQHRQMHGETEKERLTKGKHIVIWNEKNL